MALTVAFGSLGSLLLWRCRRHYARSMVEADAMERGDRVDRTT
jgi:hypothetical protein